MILIFISITEMGKSDNFDEFEDALDDAVLCLMWFMPTKLR